MRLAHTKPKLLTCLGLRTWNRRKSSSKHLKGTFYWWMKKWNVQHLGLVSKRVLTPWEHEEQVTLQKRVWHLSFFDTSHLVVRSRDKVVGIVTSLLATGPRNLGSIPCRSKRFFSLRFVKTGSGVHTVPCLLSKEGPSLRVKRPRREANH